MASEGDDARDTGALARGQHGDCVARRKSASHDGAGEAPERMIRTADPLHRHAEAGALPALFDLHGFQVLQQGFTPVPRGRCRTLEHVRSEEHTSELQSLMRISYAVFCLKKNNK